MEVIVLSGGFDPVHDGHISMFREAAQKYDHVIVGLNSDDWLTRKKGRAFMPYDVRKSVLQSIKWIDEVVGFNDDYDNACDVLEYAISAHTNVTFGNGGDRAEGNFPELEFCKQNDIAVDDTLGGATKINSSSDILAQWTWQLTKRDWGLWKVLADYKTVKVKELVVNPKSELSWQSHEHRNEIWFVRQGTATIYYSSDNEGKEVFVTTKRANQSFDIPVQKWHQLVNETEELLSIIEIQYGFECVESDILRGSRPPGNYLPSY